MLKVWSLITKLHAVMPSIIAPSVVMLCVFMLNVMAPLRQTLESLSLSPILTGKKSKNILTAPRHSAEWHSGQRLLYRCNLWNENSSLPHSFIQW